MAGLGPTQPFRFLLSGHSANDCYRATRHAGSDPQEPLEPLQTRHSKEVSRSFRCSSIVAKRVFDIDINHCPHCGGQLKLIAAIARILTHLGLAAQPPTRAPAVQVDLFEVA